MMMMMIITNLTEVPSILLLRQGIDARNSRSTISQHVCATCVYCILSMEYSVRAVRRSIRVVAPILLNNDKVEVESTGVYFVVEHRETVE